MRVPRLPLVAFAAGCTASPAGGGVGPSGPPGEVDEVSTSWLPSDAPRLGAAGRVSPGLCVGLVWNFTGKQVERHCDDFDDDFPYAVVTSTDAPCGTVSAFRPNAVVRSIHGCIEPMADDSEGTAAMIDISATISGALFVGEIHLVAP